MKALLAYPRNNKAMYLARVQAHREADELVQGIPWETNGTTRGCAVGCTLHCYDHARYPKLLGVPEELAYLQDAIFEGLPQAEALAFPEAFLSAIQPGADLSLVWPRFAVRLLKRCRQRIGKGREAWRRKERQAVDGVLALYTEWVRTGVKPAVEKFEAAAWAARAEARSSWVPGVGARDRDGEAAESLQQRDDLLELLAAAPIPSP